MSELMRSIDFSNLVEWALDEYKKHGTIFSLPKEKFYQSKSGKKEKIVLGDEITTVIGPAAGPNSQLAQNIIVSYLAGARFIELKTVQIMDGEEIQKAVARPCINVQDEGYNCEWSTELTVPQAYDEYIKAYFAIQVLAKELGISATKDFVYNMSVGYTLEGIKSEKIDTYLNDMIDASNNEVFIKCKKYLEENLDKFERFTKEDLDKISPHISNAVTESTLHGCPAEEIELIASHLIVDKGLHTFIKCNPTLLGYEYARKSLDDLGYDYIAFTDNHFKNDLQYGDGIAMFRRLIDLAEKHGKKFGLKITNTFPVDVKRGELPSEEMYMSGRALLPLTISLAEKLTREFDGRLAISYSGGANALNIADLFSTGISPITIATNILKPGGYERFNQMAEEMEGLIGGGYEGIDVQKLTDLKNKILSSKEAHKLYRGKVDSRKTESELPLFDCFKAPCKDGGCPINQQIPEYLLLVSEGRYDEAMKVIAMDNASPMVLGKICAHHCEEHCTRVDYEKTLQIRDMKYIATSNAQKNYIENLRESPIKSDKKVAIVGAGPVGVSAGLYLRRNGIDVTIFEEKDKAYGIVSHVIPEFRVSKEDIQADIDLALKTGVKIEYNKRIDDFQKLKEDYDYVIIATGAWGKTKSPVKVGKEHITDALEFLENYKNGKDMSRYKKIAVVGAGDVAMDCVRVAKKLQGADNAKLVYRRTIAYMPALQEEVEEVIDEGIEIIELLSPIEYNGKSLKCEKMKLGDFDASGRKSCLGTGEFVEMEFDIVVAATGATVISDQFIKNGIKIDDRKNPVLNDKCQSSIENLYIIGDCKRGPSTIVKGMGDAKKVALDILAKENMTNDFRKLEYPEKENYLRRRRGILKGAMSTKGEGKRCLKCDQICEVCKEVCPNRANISLKIEGFENLQIIHIDGMCNECGNCAMFCPHAGKPYKDKFTVFWTYEDFADSTNTGMLKIEDGYKIRLPQGEIKEFDKDLNSLDEKMKKLIKGIEKSYKFYIEPTGKVY